MTRGCKRHISCNLDLFQVFSGFKPCSPHISAPARNLGGHICALYETIIFKNCTWKLAHIMCEKNNRRFWEEQMLRVFSKVDRSLSEILSSSKEIKRWCTHCRDSWNLGYLCIEGPLGWEASLLWAKKSMFFKTLALLTRTYLCLSVQLLTSVMHLWKTLIQRHLDLGAYYP